MTTHITARKQERGPMSKRGLQFAQEQSDKLLQAVSRAMVTLRMIRSAQRPTLLECSELGELRKLTKDDLNQRRREVSALLTDLRAELRRRGHILP
jgi:hypothetical protein